MDHISGETLKRLKRYDWPGNVRELENAIERAVVLAKSRTLANADFSFLSRPSLPRALCGASLKKETPTLKEMEQAYILETLGNCDWNITRSAGVLDINRVTLHKKIERYNLRAQKK